MKDKDHENIVLKFGVASAKSCDVLEIGGYLTEMGCDDMVDGGFWVWDVTTNTEFYSKNFKTSLGFSETDEFPSHASSWQDLLSNNELELVKLNFRMHLNTDGEHPYKQLVNYPVKGGGMISVICSGTLFSDDQNAPKIMVGSHKIVQYAV